MTGRTIAIGDVHGCARELERLLALVEPRPIDRVVLLGDLINRGPDSRRVLEIAREVGAIPLLGNHEWRLLSYFRLQDPDLLKRYDYDTLDQLQEEDWDYLARMRLTWEIPEEESVLVHAGFLPGKPWRRQTVSVLTEIQVVDPRGEPRKRSESPGSPHWSTLWSGPPYVIYGHTPRPEVARTEWTLGLDTGCVHGGHLTACLLPGREIVQVRARRAYSPKDL